MNNYDYLSSSQSKLDWIGCLFYFSTLSKGHGGYLRVCCSADELLHAVLVNAMK